MVSLTDELAIVEAKIAELTTIRDYLRERAGQTNGATSTTPRPRRARVQQAGRITAAKAAEKVLAKAAAPMRTPDLLVAVQAEGARIGSADNLYKTMARSDKFKKAGRGLWTLA